MRVFLKANEKLYINGAVIRADRKVSIELLNDVSFLLENHVMQAEEATTPLRRLYFVVQLALMEPDNPVLGGEHAGAELESARAEATDPMIVAGLDEAEIEITKRQFFRALKIIRRLIALENEPHVPAMKGAGRQVLASEPVLKKAVGGTP